MVTTIRKHLSLILLVALLLAPFVGHSAPDKLGEIVNSELWKNICLYTHPKTKKIVLKESERWILREMIMSIEHGEECWKGATKLLGETGRISDAIWLLKYLDTFELPAHLNSNSDTAKNDPKNSLSDKKFRAVLRIPRVIGVIARRNKGQDGYSEVISQLKARVIPRYWEEHDVFKRNYGLRHNYATAMALQFFYGVSNSLDESVPVFLDEFVGTAQNSDDVRLMAFKAMRIYNTLLRGRPGGVD